MAVIDRKFRDVCAWYQTNSLINIYESNFEKATEYFDFITNNDTTPEKYMGGISMFNFRSYDEWDVSFAEFLNKNRAEFGASVEYIMSNEQVYSAFAKDISKSYASDVILALRNIKVLIYNGQNDVVVNTAGVMQYLNSLNWDGIHQWKRKTK